MGETAEEAAGALSEYGDAEQVGQHLQAHEDQSQDCDFPFQGAYPRLLRRYICHAGNPPYFYPYLSEKPGI